MTDGRRQLLSDKLLEEVAGLLYAPTADLPFGKLMRIGGTETTIYERAIEQGYQAGIQAFKDYLHTHEEVEIPTDHELTNMIEHRHPPDLSPRNEVIWRAYFVVGYTCAHLGIASLE